MISKYNEKMGGVDHFDQMIEYYRPWTKTRKLPLKQCSHQKQLLTATQYLCNYSLS